MSACGVAIVAVHTPMESCYADAQKQVLTDRISWANVHWPIEDNDKTRSVNEHSGYGRLRDNGRRLSPRHQALP